MEVVRLREHKPAEAVYGYYGRYANVSLGRMTWYATRRDRPVLVNTRGNRKIMLTPNGPDAFVNEPGALA